MDVAEAAAGAVEPEKPRGLRSAKGARRKRDRDREGDERLPLDEVRTKYYLRLLVERIGRGSWRRSRTVCRPRGVSVAQVFQEPGVRGEASITMLTHEARDKDARDAVKGIAELPAVRKAPRAVRIFDI